MINLSDSLKVEVLKAASQTIYNLIVTFFSLLSISVCQEAQLPQHRLDQHQELWQNYPHKGLFFPVIICDKMLLLSVHGFLRE